MLVKQKSDGVPPVEAVETLLAVVGLEDGWAIGTTKVRTLLHS